MRFHTLVVFAALAQALGAPTIQQQQGNATVNAAGGPSGCTTDDPSFDYLLLVLQWPPGQESASWPAGAKLDDFTLHGLWPSRIGSDVNSYPCTCTSEAFDADKVSSLLPQMKARWPSYTGQNMQFWSHEWSKHGTCCNHITGLTDQPGFFSTALGLRDKLDFLGALTKASIKPGANYSYDKMAAAVKAVAGFVPLMGCKKGNTLSEVGMCYSKSTLQLIDCDTSVKTQSGDEVSDCDSAIPVVFKAASSPAPPPAPSSGLCKDYGCGKFLRGKPCQCNSECSKFDNCCPDYAKVCPPSPPPSPGPSPPPAPPSPGGKKCVPDTHGPVCTSDADCTKYPSCVRCAKSGFCTCASKATGKCA